MKKVWRKLCRRELLFDFLMLAMLVLLAGGFLTFLMMKVMDVPFDGYWDTRMIGITVVVVFILILLATLSFYRLSASYIRRYKDILDSISMPVILTDKNAVWTQVNKAAREAMSLEQDSELGGLNSSHLINLDGSVMEKVWMSDGTEYRVSGCRLDEGYMIILTQSHGISDCHKTRSELIDEINRLFGRLSTATDQFHDCASSIAGCTVQQAGIISELTSVITGIAAGEYQEINALNEKMCVVKANMEQHIENSQANLETVRQTVKELDSTCDSIGNALHNIDSVS